jgi:site-specific recombinase XerD
MNHSNPLPERIQFQWFSGSRKKTINDFWFCFFFQSKSPKHMAKQNRPLGGQWTLLLHGLKQWLTVLGYSELGIPSIVQAVQQFLIWLQANDIHALGQLQDTYANVYMQQEQQRLGQRSGKPLSTGHMNKQIQALLLFNKYLRETGKYPTGFSLQRLEEKRPLPVYLTTAEVQHMYEVTADNVLGMRDRAMLAVYYGCGLRLNEGVNLELKDILRDRQILHVRKGKHYKERLVPMSNKTMQMITLYIDVARPQLMQQHLTDRLFLDANKGRPMQRQSLYIRIKSLARKAKIKKAVGTHTLRHSIATHLLQSGMRLEQIQQFLGHSTMDSTQIYTHLSHY